MSFLKLENQVSQIFSTDEIIPSAGQGIIALQSRNDDDYIKSLLENINDTETAIKANSERKVLKVLEGDCETAVGVYSNIENGQITLKAELFSLNGQQKFYESGSSDINNGEELGLEIGKKLKHKAGNSYKK